VWDNDAWHVMEQLQNKVEVVFITTLPKHIRIYKKIK